ncbi:MAG: hypothetical protein MJB57_06865 [Gemmatimonadetes bacterium]|nr:hypothetical protein [Gemmatimonadota bacterium]
MSQDGTCDGLFVVLEGVDGAGKTTIATELGDRLPESRVAFLDRKTVPDRPGFVRTNMQKLASLLWHEADGTEDNLLPTEYWLHLQAAWYAAFTRWVLAPATRRCDCAVVDGWYYKLQAKLRLSGYRIEYLRHVFSGSRAPDSVVLLDIDPRDVWRRRIEFSPAELGLHGGYDDLGRDSFLAFQGGAARQLRRFASELDWHVVPVDSHHSVDAVATRVAAWLGDRIESARAAG